MSRQRQRAIRAVCGLASLLAATAVVAASNVRLVTPASPEAVILRLDVRAAPLAEPALGSAQDRALLAQADRLQYQHRFDAAELQLDRWLAQHPSDAAVLLQRAQLRLALGKPRAALADCWRAAAGLPALVATGCQAQVLGALGDLARARSSIESALASTGIVARVESSMTKSSAADPPWLGPNAAAVSWAAGIAAELAGRAGDPVAANEWHGVALATAGDSHFPRIAYAEFLLAQRQPERALALLAAAPDAAAVMSLRRRALAERRP